MSGAHLTLLWAKAGEMPLRTAFHVASPVLAETKDVQAGLAVPCIQRQDLMHYCYPYINPTLGNSMA